jgi:hypothetical protein
MQLAKITTRGNLIYSTGLDAARVGAVNTGILLFSAASTPNNWMIRENDADAGTSLKFTQRGIYLVTLQATVPAAGEAAFGISLDCGAARLLATANPINTTVDILAGQHVIAPAATQLAVDLCYAVQISDTIAGDPAQGFLRFHGNDGAAGVIAAGDVISAVTRFTVTQLGDVAGA